MTKSFFQHNPSSSSGSVSTPLHRAVQNQATAEVEQLLNEGALVDSVDEHENTPLCYAVRVAKVDIVKLLVESGADLERKDDCGMTPLQYAARAAALSQDGAEPASYMLASNGSKMLLRPAIDKGRSYEDIQRLLIAKGANTDNVPPLFPRTPVEPLLIMKVAPTHK